MFSLKYYNADRLKEYQNRELSDLLALLASCRVRINGSDLCLSLKIYIIGDKCLKMSLIIYFGREAQRVMKSRLKSSTLMQDMIMNAESSGEGKCQLVRWLK